jgi:hypothetical protein
VTYSVSAAKYSFSWGEPRLRSHEYRTLRFLCNHQESFVIQADVTKRPRSIFNGVDFRLMSELGGAGFRLRRLGRV